MRKPAEKPEPEEVNARKEDDSVVLIPADKFRLPEVLRIIESGKTVIVMPSPREPA